MGVATPTTQNVSAPVTDWIFHRIIAHSNPQESFVYCTLLFEIVSRGISPERKQNYTAQQDCAPTSSGCSFGGDFAGSTRPCCGRGREGPCFAVCALVCDFSPKAECVPTFTRESEHGPFVREAEKHDERWSEIELLLIVRVHREPGNVCI